MTKLHQYGDLNESKILEYAQAHKIQETVVGLSLLCSLPVDVVERTLIDKNKEILLILAKALGFSWETTMSLLFLGVPDHRIVSSDLDELRGEFAAIHAETSQSILKLYQSRKHAHNRIRRTSLASTSYPIESSRNCFDQALGCSRKSRSTGYARNSKVHSGRAW